MRTDWPESSATPRFRMWKTKMDQIIFPNLFRNPTSPYWHNKTNEQTTGRNPLLHRVFACVENPPWLHVSRHSVYKPPLVTCFPSLVNDNQRRITLFSHTFCEILLHHTSTAKQVHKPLAGILCYTAFSHVSKTPPWSHVSRRSAYKPRPGHMFPLPCQRPLGHQKG